jgi:hypothetical protein
LHIAFCILAQVIFLKELKKAEVGAPLVIEEIFLSSSKISPLSTIAESFSDVATNLAILVEVVEVIDN